MKTRAAGIMHCHWIKKGRRFLAGFLWVCIVAALTSSGVAAAEGGVRVRNGIDVLRDQGFAPLSGKRIGLVTNHTGVASDGTSTIDLLFKSGVCKLVALFSPEHGIRGMMDSKVSSSVDDATGLPIFSLYGDTRRPSAEALKGIDALVYDIQDIGARFYTYSTTLAYCIEEAAKAGIPIYVLDRPNPIGGRAVEGPMLDKDKTSFIGYLPMPVRHGMTLGELAGFFNAANKIGADVRVIPMKGWQRSQFFYATGQVWINPSPNMRSLQAAILYPGICLLEATNVSVGRGTDKPFEIIGAPWIEPVRLAALLDEARVPGVKFIPVYFVPNASTNQGLKCGGIQFVLTDPEKVNSVLVGLTLVSTLQKLYADKFDIDKVIRLMGNDRSLQALKKGQAPAAILQAGASEMAGFMADRNKALIYSPNASPKERKR
jgi:uncharacterized protein YbbC (DUF1343 family)